MMGYFILLLYIADPNKPCLTKTLGGNANGSCCAFPFKWKNSLHYSCIKTEGYGHWCGTTHDYDKDGSWGNCIGEYTISLNVSEFKV